jgi:hypothetical protein
VIDRNDCFSAQLAPTIEPDHAGVNTASRVPRAWASRAGTHRKFDDGYQIAKRLLAA